jgi:hypothetical protein
LEAPRMHVQIMHGHLPPVDVEISLKFGGALGQSDCRTMCVQVGSGARMSAVGQRLSCRSIPVFAVELSGVEVAHLLGQVAPALQSSAWRVTAVGCCRLRCCRSLKPRLCWTTRRAWCTQQTSWPPCWATQSRHCSRWSWGRCCHNHTARCMAPGSR